MIGYFENLFRAFRRRVSRSELIIALLGLPVSKDSSAAPGLILIQIDGLSRHQMETAMENGRLPFLRRLMRRENYELRTFYSGLPASTPAVQAELLYGVRDIVPAFSFLNRNAKRVFSMFDSDSAKHVEAELNSRGEGLLRGGSSWSNVYTGGASTDDAHFCASRLGIGDTFRTRRVIQALTFPILHFASLLRLLGLLFVEFCVAIRDLCQGVRRGESWRMELRTVFSRVAVCIFLREILTIGVKIDVARGLPIIHANFLGYDEQSHRRGPSSAFAHWTLKGIDRAVRQIYRAARRSVRRDYQVWIFSDHGHERTNLFKHDGMELDEIIRNELDGFDSSAQPTASRPAYRRSHAYILRKSGDRIAEGYQEKNAGQGDEQWFSIAAMGPLGHLYLIHPRAQAQKRQLVERLVREGGVPGALVCDACQNIEWLSHDRKWTLPEQAPNFLPHTGPIKDEVARDLMRLCRQQCAGDIILFGWSPDGSPMTFVNEHGSHAGPGLEETQGFVLLPPATRLPEGVKEFLRPSALRAAALHHLGRRLLPRPKKPAKARHFRVMTYNVHGCRGMDGRVLTSRIARVIEEHQPDLIALQELDFGRRRSERHDQPNLIADALGMNAQFCPTVVDKDEQYGHALLCHWPMHIVRTAIFSHHARQRHIEPRGALWVRVEAEGAGINLMNTHFGLRHGERIAQAEELAGADWIGKVGDAPLILCGDFNMLSRSKPYRIIAGRLRDVQTDGGKLRPLKTYSTFRPFARIDHIFVSRHFTVERVYVPRNDLTRVASDHLPLIADLIFHP
ncbi:MAG TPA: endonuclease/exonuclease/phosphatase family protein [Verrucomicrobiae bacterium]|jgi:endonuclease/exonuclease/phosphatase family metal-dependent hydrolase